VLAAVAKLGRETICCNEYRGFVAAWRKPRMTMCLQARVALREGPGNDTQLAQVAWRQPIELANTLPAIGLPATAAFWRF